MGVREELNAAIKSKAAFPFVIMLPDGYVMQPGMDLRDWFAGVIQYDKSSMEDFSVCDDQDLLERYGTEEEKEVGFRMVCPGSPMPVVNIVLRQKLEARGRAELRYLEADSMMKARKQTEAGK